MNRIIIAIIAFALIFGNVSMGAHAAGGKFGSPSVGRICPNGTIVDEPDPTGITDKKYAIPFENDGALQCIIDDPEPIG